MKKIIGVLLTILLSGCTAHWVEIGNKPDGSESINQYAGDKKATIGSVAIMNDLRVKSDGQEVNASSNFEKRFMAHLKDTNIFNAVVSDMPAAKPEKYVKFALSVSENQNPHQGTNFVKGMLIGLTLYALTPVLPLSYDFESEMVLNATRWDGKTKQYVAKGNGSVSYHLFANKVMAGQEVQAKVTNSNVNALMNQLVRDADFLYGFQETEYLSSPEVIPTGADHR